MKRVVIVLSLILASTQMSHAYYYTSESASVDALKSQGFSDSMLATQDKINRLNGGLYSNYKTVYHKKHYDNKFLNAYQIVKNYVDPCQDDGDFYEHQIDFTNSWNRNSASYAIPVEKSQTADNL